MFSGNQAQTKTGDYFTKYNLPQHHREMRIIYLQTNTTAEKDYEWVC